MNSAYKDIIEELLKRSSANVEEEIRKNSLYSSKINKYISSVKELEYYQQLDL